MLLKSILDVEVDPSGQFQKFSAQYEKYQSALGKQAKMWQASGASTVAIANQFQKMTAQLLAQNAARADADNAGRKQLTTTTKMSQLWTKMTTDTKSAAANIKDATLSLMKWASIIEVVSGVLGVGGLFGINRMASNVADMRSKSMGRGVTIGQQTAMRNFSQLGLDESFLDTVAGIKYDPAKQGTLAQFGVSPNGSTSEMMVELLKGMRTRAKGTPTSQLGFLDQQTGIGVGANVWNSLKTMNEGEFQQHLKDYSSQSKSTNIDDKTAQGWANFNNAMKNAGDQLQKTFVYGLQKLEGPLINLSGAFSRLVGTILGSRGMQEGIGQLGKFLDVIANSVKDGSFQAAVTQFIDGIADMAATLKTWLHPAEAINDKLQGSPLGAIKSFLSGVSASMSGPVNPTDFKSKLSDIDKFYGLPSGTMEKDWLQSGGKTKGNAFNLNDDFISNHGIAKDPSQEAWAVGRYLSNSLGRYGGDTSKAMAPISVNVNVNSPPGTSTTVSVNQLNSIPLLAGLPF